MQSMHNQAENVCVSVCLCVRKRIIGVYTILHMAGSEWIWHKFYAGSWALCRFSSLNVAHMWMMMVLMMKITVIEQLHCHNVSIHGGNILGILLWWVVTNVTHILWWCWCATWYFELNTYNFVRSGRTNEIKDESFSKTTLWKILLKNNNWGDIIW